MARSRISERVMIFFQAEKSPDWRGFLSLRRATYFDPRRCQRSLLQRDSRECRHREIDTALQAKTGAIYQRRVPIAGKKRDNLIGYAIIQGSDAGSGGVA